MYVRILAGTALLAIFPSLSRATLDSGPYLLNVTETSIEVVYEGDSEDDPGIVEYGPTPELGASKQAERRNGYSDMFVALLTGLTPGTRYHYRLTHQGSQAPVGTFSTVVPPGTPFRFVVMGDTRTSHDAHQAVVNSVIDNGIPDLVFNIGDMVQDGEWKDQWQTFFDIERELLRNTVFGPVWGNHESSKCIYPSLYQSYFTTGDTYCYRYGNAMFIVLNTEKLTLPGTFQYEYLREVLQYANDDPWIVFKFVLFHRPGMTTADKHDPDLAVLYSLFDVFEAYGVHAVFTGHNHLYEHGVINGVHHIVTGGGGAKTAYSSRGYQPVGWDLVHTESRYHFVEVSVGADQYTATAYEPDLKVMDGYTATAEECGFPGPIPPDLLERASIGCTQASAASPAAVSLEGFANLAVLLLPGLAVACGRLRRKTAP